jgi:hypothetical protein
MTSKTNYRRTAARPLPADAKDSIGPLVEELTSAARPRDVGPDAGGAAVVPLTIPPIDVDDAEMQRGLFDILLPTVAQSVWSIFTAATGAQRELGKPVRDQDQQVRDFTSILGGVLPTLWQLLPTVIDAISQQRDIDAEVPDDDEARARWIFPLLAALAPIVIEQAPKIIDLITGSRDVTALPADADLGSQDVPPVSVLKGEYVERFGFPSIGSLFGGIAQNLPAILNVVSQLTARDITLNWLNFEGQRFPDGDVIRLAETDLGDPDQIQITLHQPWNTWWKGIELLNGDSVVYGLAVSNNSRDAEGAVIDVNQLAGAGHLRFSKAKAFGIHTAMYDIGELTQKRGKRLDFHWLDD